MALTLVNYPVTGSDGDYRNIFPSQRELNVSFNRKDILISSISSGTGGVVQITFSSNLDGSLSVGDFITWNTDAYGNRSSRVVNVISLTEIEIEDIFFSTDATNGWANYLKGWFVEVRFVDSATATDQQGVVNLVLDDFAQVPAGIDGNLSVDIAEVRDILIPDFSLESENIEGLSKSYKIQYRESYELNRNGTWISPNPDVEVLLVMANKPLPFNDFTDLNISQGIFYEGKTKIVTYIYSDVNDNGSSEVMFTLNQYTLNKQLLTTQPLVSFSDQSGVLSIKIDPGLIDEDTVFYTIEASLITSSNQYDPVQYDPVQYA